MRRRRDAAVLTVGSVTYALKGQSILDGGYIPSRVVRPENGSGCAYGLEIDGRDLSRARSLLTRGGVPHGVR